MINVIKIIIDVVIAAAAIVVCKESTVNKQLQVKPLKSLFGCMSFAVLQVIKVFMEFHRLWEYTFVCLWLSNHLKIQISRDEYACIDFDCGQRVAWVWYSSVQVLVPLINEI